MNKLMIALAIGTAAIGGAAVAQDAPGAGWHRGGGMGLMRADTNGDGVVTRAEYQTQLDERFTRIDANGNGRIDADEGFGGRSGRQRGAEASPPPPPTPDAAPGMAVAPPPPPPASRMAGLTRDQFRAAAMTRFDRIDTNHDGKVDQAELAAMPMRGPGTPPPAQPPQQ